MRPGQSSGFTLIEVLVAATLLGLVTVLVGQGLRLGLRALDRVRAANAIEAQWRGVHGTLRHLLERARPHVEPTEGVVAFYGDRESLTFVTLADGPFGDGALTLFTLSRGQDDGLVLDRCLSRGAGTGTACLSEPDRLVLQPSAGVLRVSYYGAPQFGDEVAWQESWGRAARLPSLVRIALDEDVVIVAPRLAP